MFIAFFGAGCSVMRSTKSVNQESSDIVSSENIIKEVQKNNLTNNNFFIEKAEIEYSNAEIKRKILGSLKFEAPDKYLISLRSAAGIEFARVYIEKDTLMINDRINRKFYRGYSGTMISKFHVSPDLLPLIIGDFLGDIMSVPQIVSAEKGIISRETVFKGMRINFLIDVKRGKVNFAEMKNSFNERNVQIKFSKYIENQYIAYPGVIEVVDLDWKLKIKIRRIQVRSNEKIEFIPGKGYKFIEIL